MVIQAHDLISIAAISIAVEKAPSRCAFRWLVGMLVGMFASFSRLLLKRICRGQILSLADLSLPWLRCTCGRLRMVSVLPHGAAALADGLRGGWQGSWRIGNKYRILVRNTQTSVVCCSCSAQVVARTAAWTAVPPVSPSSALLSRPSGHSFVALVHAVRAGWAGQRALRGSALGEPSRASSRSMETRRPQMKKARRIRQALINLVAGAGFEPTTFGL